MIKKGLKVRVLAGKDKKKEGEVIEIDYAKLLDKKKNFIHMSNLRLVDEQKKIKKTEAKK